MSTWADRRRGLEEIDRSPRPPRRILVNLVGPPGAGKSTLATAFCKQHESWAFLSIDHYLLSGLEHREAWESMRTHARLYPRVIVESSGLSRFLRPLLLQSAHATIIVTSETARERRQSRVKEKLPQAERWGSQDDLAKATERLPRIYPTALHLSADGPWPHVLAQFAAVMATAERRALAGGEPPPKEIRKPDKRPRKERDPVKRRASKAVYHALRRGDLVRLPCEVCGEEPAEAHHEDYSRPLEVKWLCRLHHEQADRVRERAAERRRRASRSPSA